MSTPPSLHDAAARVILDHAREPVITLLRDLGFATLAADVAEARSISALRYIIGDAMHAVRARMRPSPCRRATLGAIAALHSAILLSLRGSVQNAAVMSLGVFTQAAYAQAWRRQWWQLFRWPRVRARVLAEARLKLADYLAPTPHQPSAP